MIIRRRQEERAGTSLPHTEDLSESRRPDLGDEDLDATVLAPPHGWRERLGRALERLPEEHAIPLRLHFLEDLSLKEVAERLSLPSPDAARMRVQRARTALKELLEGDKGG